MEEAQTVSDMINTNTKATNFFYPTFLFKISFFLVIIFSLNACDSESGSNQPLTFQAEDEKSLGAAIHTAMINSDNFNIMSEDQDADDYIDRVWVRMIGTNVMENDRATFDWNVYVILNDDVQDCFATVGGYIYIYSGLMKTLENEAQFMGVLAHEMFYIDESYHTNLLKTQYPISILLEVARGNDESLAMEMLQSFYNIPRDPSLVEAADSYGMGLLCYTSAYAREMRIAIEDSHQSNNIWYKNHKQADGASFESRINSMKSSEMSCGGIEVKQEQYQTFLNNLP